MTATMFSKKITNAFQQHNENTIQPFYQDSGAMFYKNKLINVEDIVEHYEMNTDDNNEFEAYSSKISYLLTFEDDKGDKHNYISSVKPKNIGAVYYYVIKEDKLENIFPEKDRKKLKPYISVGTKYDNNKKNKLYSFTSFIENNHTITLPVLLFIVILFITYASFSFLKFDIFHAFLLGIIAMPIPMGVLLFINERINKNFYDKAKAFTTKKENEERENILKTFI